MRASGAPEASRWAAPSARRVRVEPSNRPAIDKFSYFCYYSLISTGFYERGKYESSIIKSNKAALTIIRGSGSIRNGGHSERSEEFRPGCVASLSVTFEIDPLPRNVIITRIVSMNCLYCNTPLRNGARFCQACGRAIVHTGVGSMSNPFDHLRSPQTEGRQIITVDNVHKLAPKASFVIDSRSPSSSDIDSLLRKSFFSDDYSRLARFRRPDSIKDIFQGYRMSVIDTFSGLTLIDIPIGHDHRPVKFSRDNTKILIGTKIYNCLDGSPLSTVSEIRGGATTDSIISGDLQKYLVLNLYGMKELLSTPLTLNFGVPFAYCDLKSGTEIHKFRLKPSFPFRFIVDSSQDGSKVLITDWLDSDGLSSRIAFLDTLSSDIVNINYSGPTGLRAKNPLIQARFSNDEESVFLSSIDSVSIFSVQ